MRKSIKTILSLILSAGMVFAFGCDEEESGENSLPVSESTSDVDTPAEIDAAKTYAALKAEIESYGTNFTRTMNIHAEGYGFEGEGDEPQPPVSLGYANLEAVSKFDGDKVAFNMSGDMMMAMGYSVCYDGTAVYLSNGNFSMNKYACDIETFKAFSYIPQTFVSISELQWFNLSSTVLENSTVKVENDEIIISCSLSGDEAKEIFDKTMMAAVPDGIEYSVGTMDYAIHATTDCKFKYIEITMDYDYTLDEYPVSTKDNIVKISYSDLGTTKVNTPANASAYTLTEIPEIPQA